MRTFLNKSGKPKIERRNSALIKGYRKKDFWKELQEKRKR